MSKFFSDLIDAEKETYKIKYGTIGDKKFEWTDEMVKELIYQKFIIPMHSYGDVQSCLNEFKRSKQIDSRDWEVVVGGLVPVDGKSMKEVIESVRRLSDGVVFSVGDEVVSAVNDNNPITIEKIHVINEHYIYLDNCPLVDAKKVDKPKPLLITEDGVDVFDYDKHLYHLGDNGKCIGWYIYSDKAGWLKNNPHGKVFSIKENAEEYVLLNKPLLSVMDVCKITAVYGVDYVCVEKDAIKLASDKLSKK